MNLRVCLRVLNRHPQHVARQELTLRNEQWPAGECESQPNHRVWRSPMKIFTPTFSHITSSQTERSLIDTIHQVTINGAPCLHASRILLSRVVSRLAERIHTT